MEFICEDNGTNWIYDGIKYYYRIEGKDVVRKIDEQYLPDPEVLFNQRIMTAKKDGGQIDIDKLRPSPATYKLWEHYSVNKHNKLQLN